MCEKFVDLIENSSPHVIVHYRNSFTRSQPAKLADLALQAMREQYDDLEAESIAETVAGRNLVGYDMHFFCLDLTNTALVRSYATEQATYVVLYQADDLEFSGIERVFQAITLSLLR